MDESKKCNRCKETKPLTGFRVHRDGYFSICKACESEYKKLWKAGKTIPKEQRIKSRKPGLYETVIEAILTNEYTESDIKRIYGGGAWTALTGLTLQDDPIIHEDKNYILAEDFDGILELIEV